MLKYAAIDMQRFHERRGKPEERYPGTRFVRILGEHVGDVLNACVVATSNDEDVINDLCAELNTKCQHATFVLTIMIKGEQLEIWKVQTKSGWAYLGVETSFLQDVCQVVPNPYQFGWLTLDKPKNAERVLGPPMITELIEVLSELVAWSEPVGGGNSHIWGRAKKVLARAQIWAKEKDLLNRPHGN